VADDFTIATAGGTVVVRAVQLGGGQVAQVLFVAPMRKTPVGPPEKLSVGVGATVGLSPPGGATHALVFVESSGIRYYDDGSTPTTGATGNGAPIAAGSALEVDLASFTNFKMIAQTATATVHVLYSKYV
jgi:hypothetical protein